MIELNDRYFHVLGSVERPYVAYWKYTAYNTIIRPNSKRWALSLAYKNKDNDCTMYPIHGSPYFILTIFQNNFDRPWVDLVIEEAELSEIPYNVPSMGRLQNPNTASVSESVEDSPVP